MGERAEEQEGAEAVVETHAAEAGGSQPPALKMHKGWDSGVHEGISWQRHLHP